MALFIDSASRWMKVYGLRSKSETLGTLKKFVADMSGTGVPKAFRMDNGTEFTSEAVARFCDDTNIRREFTAPDTPQQNGVAESAIWRVMKAGHAARIEATRLFPGVDFSQVPNIGAAGDRLWLESCHWEAGTFNRSPCSVNPGMKSPHEMPTGVPPPLQFVPFLQPGYMRVARGNKMEVQAVLCFYLNSGDNHHFSAVKVI